MRNTLSKLSIQLSASLWTRNTQAQAQQADRAPPMNPIKVHGVFPPFTPSGPCCDSRHRRLFGIKGRRVHLHPQPPFFSMSYQYPAGYSSMPTTPQTPFHHWDGGDPSHLEQQVLQHPLQQPAQQPQDAYAAPSTATPQDLIPMVPSQDQIRQHEGEELRHLPPMAGPSMRHQQHMRPNIQVDTRQMHVGTSASPPSGPPSAGGVYPGTGPVRARASPAHVDARMVSHPYRRPQSAGTGILRPRREHEELQQSVRPQRQVPSSSMPAPIAPPARPPYSGIVSAT